MKIRDMIINIEHLKQLIEVFYQPPFKIFQINSVNETEFIKPIGVFVSLGITTAPKVIENIKNIINSEKEYTAQIAKISSKLMPSGQFLNTIIQTDNLDQFETDLNKLEERLCLFNREEAEEELRRLQSLMNDREDLETIQRYASKISILLNLIKKLDKEDGWDQQLVWKDENEDYKPFHKLVNYQRVDDIEYRLGIYVRSKIEN